MMASVQPSQGVGGDGDMASSLALLKKKNAHLRSKTRSHLDMNEDLLNEKVEGQERVLVRSQSMREPAAHRKEDGAEDSAAGANAPRPKVSAKVGALPDCFQTTAGGRVSRASRAGGRRRESNAASRPATPTDTTGSEAEAPPRVQRRVQVARNSGAAEETKDADKPPEHEPVPSPVPIPVQKPVPPQGAQAVSSTPSRKRSVVSAILNQISKHTPFSFGSSNGTSNNSSREPSVGRAESTSTQPAPPAAVEKKPVASATPSMVGRASDRSLERMKADEAAEKRKREAAEELERAEAIVQQQLALIEQERHEEGSVSLGVTSRRKVSTYTDEELDDIMEESRTTRRVGRAARREVAAPVSMERGSFRSNSDGKIHGRAVPKRDAVSSERSGDDSDKAYLRRRRSSIPSAVPGPPATSETLKNERERRMEARRSRKERNEDELNGRPDKPKRSRSKGRARREREKEHERIVSNIENEMGLSSSAPRPQSPVASAERPPRPEKRKSEDEPDPMAADPMGRPRTNISTILSEARQTTRPAESAVTHSTGLPKPKNLAQPPLPDEAKPKSSVAKQVGVKGHADNTEKDEAPRTAPPARLQPKPSAQANANGQGGDGERRPITTDSILRGSLANSISQARSTVSLSQARGEGGKKLPPSRLPLYNNGGSGTGGVKKPPGVLKSSTWSAGYGSEGTPASGGSSAEALMASYAEVAEGLDKLRGKMRRGNSLRGDGAPLPAISEKGSTPGSARDQVTHRSATGKAEDNRSSGVAPATAAGAVSARVPVRAGGKGAAAGEPDKENLSKANGDRDDNGRTAKKPVPKARSGVAAAGSQSAGSGDDNKGDAGAAPPVNTKASPPKRRVLKRDRSKDKSPNGARARPAAAPVPTGPKTEEEIMMELCGKQMEIESVMRVKVRDAKDYDSAHGAFVSLSRFLSQVSQLADLLKVTDGIVYQELLARSVGVNLDARGGQCFDDMKSDGFLPMHQAKVLDRSERLNETLGADLDVILSKNSDIEPLSNLVHYATELRTMLKVKVEDANDLKMASMVIHDGQQFFNTVSTMAADKGVKPIAFFEDLRKM